MQKFYKWEGVTSADRIQVINNVKATISDAGGAIINFTKYSDLALSLSIEIEDGKLVTLHQALEPFMKIEKKDSFESSPESTSEVMVLLNISFSLGSGGLRSEIPDVPG